MAGPSRAVVGVKGQLTGQNPGDLRSSLLQAALPDCSHLPPAYSPPPTQLGACPQERLWPTLGSGHMAGSGRPCLGGPTSPGTQGASWRLCRRVTTSMCPAASACRREPKGGAAEGLLTSLLASTPPSPAQDPHPPLLPPGTQGPCVTLVPTAPGTERGSSLPTPHPTPRAPKCEMCPPGECGYSWEGQGACGSGRPSWRRWWSWSPGGTHHKQGTAPIIARLPQVSPCLPPRPQAFAVRPGGQPGRGAKGGHQGLLGTDGHLPPCLPRCR